MKLRNRIVLILCVVAGLALLVWALAPAPVAVTATRVVAGPFVESVDEEGRTRLRDTYTVSSPIAGYLHRVTLEPGDRVVVDQVVFRMEAQPVPALDARSLEQAREQVSAVQARFQSARANLDTARAETRFAESEYERYRQLHARNLISATEMDRRQSVRDRQRAIENAAAHAVEVARFEVDSARAMLQIGSGERSPDDQPQLEVRAPSGGVVLRRHRCCEGAVGAGEPIMEIGDLADLEIQVDLLSMDAVRVRPEMRVLITGWGGDTTLEGRVRRIEPAGFTRTSALGVDEQRVPVVIDFADVQAAADVLGVGFRVEAEVILWEGDDIVQIPTSALFREAGRWSVFVIDDARARLRHVDLGRRAGLVTQVAEGLTPGDIVITHPGDRVRDGVRVAADVR